MERRVDVAMYLPPSLSKLGIQTIAGALGCGYPQPSLTSDFEALAHRSSEVCMCTVAETWTRANRYLGVVRQQGRRRSDSGITEPPPGSRHPQRRCVPISVREDLSE
jgi:hypothetical protein